MTITGISLFTGAGGMDVGFRNAGVEIIYANEICKYAAETYKTNNPNTLISIDDLNNIIDIFNKYNGTDLVFGGPPCQGFSVAGKMDPEDKRSSLIFSYLEVVKRVKPKAFIMENVKALATLDRWCNVRKKYLSKANELKYNCLPFVLNASEYGVPQKRERVFFIGIYNDNNIFFKSEMNNLLQKQKNEAPTIREALKSLGVAGTEINPKTCTAKITFATSPVMRKSPYAGMYFNGQGRPINVDNYANTLPASMGGNKTPFIDEDYLYGNSPNDWVVNYHKGLTSGFIKPKFGEAPNRLRRITIKEAARIQTFPKNYKFCGRKASIYTQIGNAVPCKLAEAVARAVIEYISTHN